jgi:hypothetical protein
MSQTPSNHPTPGQPQLTDLMARFLDRQTAAVAAGLAANLPGDVEPHEAVPVQAVDPKHAWDEATTALGFYGINNSEKAPADWPTLVAAQPSHTGLAFAVGNFPQMVRDLAPLYRAADDLGGLPVADGPPVAIESSPKSDDLLTLGTLRLARQWDAVDAALTTLAGRLPNEEAATLWHRGRKDEAVQRWNEMAESVPVLFNRGMAALFTGRPADARVDLRKAVEQIPEASGWHHLGRLYMALAGG